MQPRPSDTLATNSPLTGAELDHAEVTGDSAVAIRIAELLASKICHGLISPVGAILNGMEIMADDDMGMGDEALALANDSAQKAGRTLGFQRAAYGAAAGRPAMSRAELQELAGAYLGDRKIELGGPAFATGQELSPEWARFALNVLALAAETLIRGGALEVQSLEPAGRGGLLVEARGEGAALRPELESALSLDVDPESLTPRSIQAHLCCRFAAGCGADLQVSGLPGGGFSLRAL